MERHQPEMTQQKHGVIQIFLMVWRFSGHKMATTRLITKILQMPVSNQRYLK